MAKKKLPSIPKPRQAREAEKAAATAPSPTSADLSYIAADLRPLAVPIGNVKFDPRNARKHPDENIAGIRGSLREYGQRKAIVVNRRTGHVEAGNGALAAALSLNWSHIAVVWVDDDQSTAIGYGLADNQSAALATWDDDVLKSLYAELETQDKELTEMLDKLAEEAGIVESEEPPEDPGAELDRAAELQKKWATCPGQLWVIPSKSVPGKTHRLLCGYSTKAEDVERLMGGEKAGLCFTSPPYAQQRDYGKKIDDWDGLMRGVFGNLPMTEDGQVLVNLGLVHKDGEWWPYWDGWIEWMREQGWRRFGWYVWDQGSGLPGDWNGRLAPSHEFVWHFNRQTVKPLHCVPKDAENVRDRTGEASMRMGATKTQKVTSGKASLNTHKIPDSVFRVQRQCGRMESGDYHPAVFPIELPKTIIQCWPGDVYEPFSGAGTTIVAGETLGNLVYAIELEPPYIAITLERLSKLGLTPELAT